MSSPKDENEDEGAALPLPDEYTRENAQALYGMMLCTERDCYQDQIFSSPVTPNHIHWDVYGNASEQSDIFHSLEFLSTFSLIQMMAGVISPTTRELVLHQAVRFGLDPHARGPELRLNGDCATFVKGVCELSPSLRYIMCRQYLSGTLMDKQAIEKIVEERFREGWLEKLAQRN